MKKPEGDSFIFMLLFAALLASGNGFFILAVSIHYMFDETFPREDLLPGLSNYHLQVLCGASIGLGAFACVRGGQMIRELHTKGVRLQIRLAELLFVPLPLSVGLMILEKAGVQNLYILAIALLNMVIGLSIGWLAARVWWHRVERPKRWPGLWISALWMTLGAGTWHSLPFFWRYLPYLLSG